MEAYTIEHLSFSYPDGAQALRDVCLRVESGEWLTLCGRSGCGKTTLLRQLKSALAPHGARTGNIRFEGKPLEQWSEREQASRIGFVLQNPDNQIVTDKVWHELAFGLESLGLPSTAIRLRVAEMASFFGIQSWFYRDVAELSGGQKQLLNLAAVMAMQPSVLLLDEPTSQLDPIAAADFLATVSKINRELGVTVILTEHRLEETLPLTDRMAVLDQGRVAALGTPREVGESLRDMKHGMFFSMPAPMRIYAGVKNSLPCPLTVREGRDWLDALAESRTIAPAAPPRPLQVSEAVPALELRDVWFRYEKDRPDVVKGASLAVRPGELFALVGGNGAGKSTALSLISGINRPLRGKVLLHGRDAAEIPETEKFDRQLAALPQNPQTLFVKDTVRKDLLEMRRDPEKVEEIARLCGLTGLLERHPYDLSGGEMQRAALAKVLLLEPRILLLDEPTKGMDGEFKRQFAEILRALCARGVAVLMVSHDIEFCAGCADICALFFDGAVVSCGAPQEFFSGNSFYTTASNRMARHRIRGAVTAEDVICACGGELPPPPSDVLPEDPPSGGTQPHTDMKPSAGKRNPPHGWALAACVLCLALIPLTIWFGITRLDDRKYYFISLLVIVESMIPFFLIFEGRKPRARELVIVAVMCAIGVAGRAAFFWLPQFKPVAAVVIIAGAALGAETGFLTGAVIAFVSNLFFGQGPWTPWQMFAFGLIGLLAGLLFYQREKKSRIALCIYGAAAVLLLYGGLLNPAAEVMFQGNPTWQMIALAYVRGIPFDLIHAAATAFFLWVAALPMLEKLDRVRSKYGLLR